MHLMEENRMLLGITIVLAMISFVCGFKTLLDFIEYQTEKEVEIASTKAKNRIEELRESINGDLTFDEEVKLYEILLKYYLD